MSDTKHIEIGDGQEISLLDIIHFFKEFHRKILLTSLVGVVVGVISCLLIGQYTATTTLVNYAGLDIPSVKYLQSALPKLEQENQLKNKDKDSEFLASEKFWEKAIKPNVLVTKADSKELLDASALNAAGSKISSITIIDKAPSKETAVKKVEQIKSFFIDGSTLIAIRDLVRGYELKVISLDSNNKKKVASAEVELDYLQKRIKNLNELKNQYPSTGGSSGQVVDAKDSGAKYLPITTQIIAATTDANNLKESLARYKDEEQQNIIFKLFVEKAKPLLEQGRDGATLGGDLLAICEQIEKGVNGSIQLIAIEEIKVALSTIQTNRVYGLKQVGDVDISNPSYMKFSGAGLFGGIFIGLLLAISIKVTRKIKRL
ncbi:hypothetical protein ICN46_11755 [Polynucleobacter sp. Latsch14-2]|uniref:hypothetical protein n=1 Tax=Polynucleobacter sp. Latsch14-2 TaxID=2576920 RepID=UPI001C0E079E|nr:hypothetical protein [Polynucleobacter sp. Latsch14-2]MBU3615565.1 hypothetical protein [Polynucleobacter sp. Latsch14-2]